MARRIAWTVAALMAGQALFGAAFGQTPTTAQRDAIRSSCRADYEAMCASIPPGGKASLQCLASHMSSLSPACQSAVAAVSGGGGGGAAPAAPRAAAAGLAQMCRADLAQFCAGIQPGGGRALMCLRRNAASLSPGCQNALVSLRR